MPETISSTRRRLRFRLSTILLLVAIAALAIAQFVSTRRVVELETRYRKLATETIRLRAEAGYLYVDDPAKVIVLRLAELDDLTWRWKLWLPAGKWKLSLLSRDIPAQGVPNGSSVGDVDGGREVQATVTARRDAADKWQLRATLDASQIGQELAAAHQLVLPRITPASMISQSIDLAGEKRQETFDAAKPVVLVRLRAHGIVQALTGGWQSKDEPKSDGVMVWIEKTK